MCTSRWVRVCVDVANVYVVLTLRLTGVTHIPRPEDWPVMPVEHLRVLFRPTNFFEFNPSMDVPGADDKKSKLAFPNGENGMCCAN